MFSWSRRLVTGPLLVARVSECGHNPGMSSNYSQVFDAALGLTDEDRASLAYRLLQSLRPPGVCSDSDPGFELELERRVADYDSGTTQASDWDDVASRLRKALDQKDLS